MGEANPLAWFAWRLTCRLPPKPLRGRSHGTVSVTPGLLGPEGSPPQGGKGIFAHDLEELQTSCKVGRRDKIRLTVAGRLGQDSPNPSDWPQPLCQGPFFMEVAFWMETQPPRSAWTLQLSSPRNPGASLSLSGAASTQVGTSAYRGKPGSTDGPSPQRASVPSSAGRREAQGRRPMPACLQWLRRSRRACSSSAAQHSHPPPERRRAGRTSCRQPRAAPCSPVSSVPSAPAAPPVPGQPAPAAPRLLAERALRCYRGCSRTYRHRDRRQKPSPTWTILAQTLSLASAPAGRAWNLPGSTAPGGKGPQLSAGWPEGTGPARHLLLCCPASTAAGSMDACRGCGCPVPHP